MTPSITNENDYLLSSYQFTLPESLIAQSPPDTRGTSRLLVYNRNTHHTTDTSFSSILSFLPKDCLLVVNNSRVVPARIKGHRVSGGKVEFLLLTPLPLIEAIPSTKGTHNFITTAEGLLRSSKQVKEGETIEFSPLLSLCVLERGEFGRCKVSLSWTGSLPEIISCLGELPLPPYIYRPDGENKNDTERYQTTYAKNDKMGSVAAPTAGLHFTADLKKSLENSGREWAEVTLYVGYGTFSPVRCNDIRNHPMHAEYIEVTPETALAITRAKQEGRKVIAVGTTSARVLEGGYIASQAKRLKGCSQNAYPSFAPYSGWINIFIYPGYSFHMIDGLLTNFHLPGSSLLMLVAALTGREQALAVYKHAIQQQYNFFSYGDAMLII